MIGVHLMRRLGDVKGWNVPGVSLFWVLFRSKSGDRIDPKGSQRRDDCGQE